MNCNRCTPLIYNKINRGKLYVETSGCLGTLYFTFSFPVNLKLLWKKKSVIILINSCKNKPCFLGKFSEKLPVTWYMQT